MKRFAKIILGVLAALVILLLVALVGINLYLQSGDVQQNIRHATEEALGMPVTVKGIVYTPWDGLALSGLSMPDPTIADAKLVEAPKFSLKFRFWPLLNQRFVISEVSLDSPHLVLRQTAKKEWVVVPPPAVLPQPTEGPPNGTSPGTGTAANAPKSPKPLVFTVELQKFFIVDGSADIVDNKGAFLARVRGLNVDGYVQEGGKLVAGDVLIDDIDYAGQLYPKRLRAHFEKNEESLKVTALKCALADGKLRAEFTVLTPRNAQPVFQLKGEIEDVSIPTLLAEAHGDGEGTAGTVVGHMELRGNPLDASTLVGAGQLSLVGAQIRPPEFIQPIGHIFEIDELQMLKLREAAMHFEINDEKFWMKDLKLRTENLIVTTHGPIKFNGKMSLEGRFQVSEKLSMLTSSRFSDSPEPAGYKEVTFNVTGRTSRPETNLLEKITGYNIGNLNNIGNALKSFLIPVATPTPSADPVQDKSAARD